MGAKETIEVLNVIMTDWHHMPKKFCIQKILGWSESEADAFLKEHKKEKKKYEKQNKSLLDKVVGCCNQQKCKND